MDFVLELAPATGGGLGELRYGMTRDEAMTALDPWHQRPGPPGLAYRNSGLSISPWFGGANHDRRSVVTGISFAGPPDKTDRVLFDGLDLWSGSLAEVVRQIRDRGHNISQHAPERYAIDDTDVWLMLQRPEQFPPRSRMSSTCSSPALTVSVCLFNLAERFARTISMRTSGRQVNAGHHGWSDGILRVMKVAYGQCGCCRLLLPLAQRHGL